MSGSRRRRNESLHNRRENKLTRSSVNVTQTCVFRTNLLTLGVVETIMCKSAACNVFVVTERARPSRVTFTVHVILRQTAHLHSLVDHFFCQVEQGFLPVPANTVGATLQTTGKRCAEFTVLTTSAIRTAARLDGVVGGVGVPTGTPIHAKGIWIIVCAIIVNVDRNITTWADILEARLGVVGRVAITNELFIAVLILSFDAFATVPVRKRDRERVSISK